MVVFNIDKLEVCVRGPRLEGPLQLSQDELLAPKLVGPGGQAVQDQGELVQNLLVKNLLVGQCPLLPPLGSDHIPGGLRQAKALEELFQPFPPGFSSFSITIATSWCFEQGKSIGVNQAGWSEATKDLHLPLKLNL